MDLADLKRYFNNVAAEATNEKAALEELATNLATLTTRNAEMAAIIKKLTDEDTQLQQKLKNLENIPQEERGPGQRQPAVVQKTATCTNCKQEVWHNSDNYFELKEDAAQRPSGWMTRF